MPALGLARAGFNGVVRPVVGAAGAIGGAGGATEAGVGGGVTIGAAAGGRSAGIAVEVLSGSCGLMVLQAAAISTKQKPTAGGPFSRPPKRRQAADLSFVICLFLLWCGDVARRLLLVERVQLPQSAQERRNAEPWREVENAALQQ